MSEIKMEEVSLELVVDFGEAEGVQAGYKEGYKDGEADGHADGYQEGYARGEDEGYASGYTKGETDGHTAGYQEGYDKGEQAGKEQGTSEYWDLFQNYGERTLYRDAFIEWGGEHLRPKYKVVPTGSGSTVRVFYNNGKLKKIEAQYFDFTQTPRTTTSAEGFYYTFAQCSQLEEVEDVGIANQKYLTRTFSGCDNLKMIACIYVEADTVFNNTFQGCVSLEHVTFDGVIGQNGLNLSACTKLSKATWQNVISCLSATTTGLSITGSLESVKKAFETAPGANNGNTSDEWLALIATKPNWTITLA